MGRCSLYMHYADSPGSARVRVRVRVRVRDRGTWVALKSTPMVLLLVLEKVSSTKRVMRHVLPTPASPTWLG